MLSLPLPALVELLNVLCDFHEHFPSAWCACASSMVGEDLNMFDMKAFPLSRILHHFFLVVSDLRYCLLVLPFAYCLYAFLCSVRQI
jgi:hypothetical protein